MWLGGYVESFVDVFHSNFNLMKPSQQVKTDSQTKENTINCSPCAVDYNAYNF